MKRGDRQRSQLEQSPESFERRTAELTQPTQIHLRQGCFERIQHSQAYRGELALRVRGGVAEREGRDAGVEEQNDVFEDRRVALVGDVTEGGEQPFGALQLFEAPNGGEGDAFAFRVELERLDSDRVGLEAGV